MIKIFTDGSSRGNPGPGGYGVVMLYKGNRKELSQGYIITTNNRMELTAVTKALEAIKKNSIKKTLQISIFCNYYRWDIYFLANTKIKPMGC